MKALKNKILLICILALIGVGIVILLSVYFITEKENKTITEEMAASKANSTGEVKEFLKLYPDAKISALQICCASGKVLRPDMMCKCTADSKSDWMIEYKSGGKESDYSSVRIAVDGYSGEITAKYPKAEYLRNSSYCESDSDCKIYGQFTEDESNNCSCCRGCVNFMHKEKANFDSMIFSSCWPVYGCTCINKTCTAIDNNYYTEASVREKNFSLCGKIIWGSDSCFEESAIAMQNTSICGMIKDADLKYSCSAIIQKQESVCKNIILESSRNLCYSDVAAAKEDPLICDKIADSESQSWIKNQCFKKIAILKKEPELCEKIKSGADNYDKILCLSGAKQDPSICDELPSEKGLEWMKEDCVNEAK